MPLQSALRKIGFRPFLPSSEIARIAVIPPLGGEDSRQNRGIAIEYRQGNRRLLLSEWPRQRFAGTPCAVRAYKADGAIWITRAGLVMTLQPDGRVSTNRVFSEAGRLVKSAGC